MELADAPSQRAIHRGPAEAAGVGNAPNTRPRSHSRFYPQSGSFQWAVQHTVPHVFNGQLNIRRMGRQLGHPLLRQIIGGLILHVRRQHPRNHQHGIRTQNPGGIQHLFHRVHALSGRLRILRGEGINGEATMPPTLEIRMPIIVGQLFSPAHVRVRAVRIQQPVVVAADVQRVRSRRRRAGRRPPP